MLTELVLATNNKGKIREIKAELKNYSLDIKEQSELGIPATEEPYHTFLENALAKARHASALSGVPCLADDSGLVVPALSHTPGVHSSRYATINATDAQNNEKLLNEMKFVQDRRAYYYAAIVVVLSQDDPSPIVAEGIWYGEILDEKRGDGGFGYDPIFYDPKLGLTGSQMSIEEKNKYSHRGKSLRAITYLLQSRQLLYSKK